MNKKSSEIAPPSPEKIKEQVKELKKPKEKETARETIESIVFAFVLAFLFRTFEAEAFVIPTGSMAPTLYGRHKDIDCEQCGYSYCVGASQELVDNGNLLVPNGRIREARCPNCRFMNTSAYKSPPFKGDRILVNKFQYEMDDPERFDVVVFKYPEDSKTNYIKRLVGLPGETIRIHHGNLYRVKENGQEEILRKENQRKERLIQIPVYDDAHPSTDMLAAGWPERWAAVEPMPLNALGEFTGWKEDDVSWKQDAGKRTFHLSSENMAKDELQWLRYRHYVPTTEDWARLENGDALEPTLRLIGDDCGYNTTATVKEINGQFREYFWVADLNVSGTVNVTSVEETPEIVWELTEGFHWNRCRLDLTTGKVRFVRVESGLDPGEEIELATAQTSVKGTGRFTFHFANVDDRLSLWLNNRRIDFGEEANYEQSKSHGMLPTEADYSPVGIAFQGTAGSVSDLVISRDIYYRGSDHLLDNGTRLLSNVGEWSRVYMNRQNDIDFFEISIPENEFFVLGDNSPASKDGRFWDTTHTVPRSAFIGKAFFIYWPHGIPIGVESGMAMSVSYHKKYANNGNIVTDRSYPLHYVPFYPNFWRMKWIR